MREEARIDLLFGREEDDQEGGLMLLRQARQEAVDEPDRPLFGIAVAPFVQAVEAGHGAFSVAGVAAEGALEEEVEEGVAPQEVAGLHAEVFLIELRLQCVMRVFPPEVIRDLTHVDAKIEAFVKVVADEGVQDDEVGGVAQHDLFDEDGLGRQAHPVDAEVEDFIVSVRLQEGLQALGDGLLQGERVGVRERVADHRDAVDARGLLIGTFGIPEPAGVEGDRLGELLPGPEEAEVGPRGVEAVVREDVAALHLEFDGVEEAEQAFEEEDAEGKRQEEQHVVQVPTPQSSHPGVASRALNKLFQGGRRYS